MGNSVGTVKIPIVSTFDASGVQAAKQGLRDLQGAQPGGGGGGSGGGGKASSAGRSSQASYADEADQIFEKTRTANEKYSYQIAKLDDLHKRGKISTDTYTRAQKQAADSLPKSAGMMQRLGVGQAGQMVADQFGLGGVTSALGGMGAAGIVAGAAAAGVAIYGLTQKLAGEAIALREHARQLGVSSTYYAGLTVAAAKAGVSVETVTNGLSGMKSMASGALTGDIGTALFLARWESARRTWRPTTRKPFRGRCWPARAPLVRKRPSSAAWPRPMRSKARTNRNPPGTSPRPAARRQRPN